MRQINQQAINLIKAFEGCRLTAYYDSVGVITIGYGSTGNHVKKGMRITADQAEELLRKDVARFEKCVDDAVKVSITDNMFGALVSFAFNLGCGALNSSTLLKKLNQGAYHTASNEFLKWVNAGGQKLPGLVRRREAERALFLLGLGEERAY